MSVRFIAAKLDTSAEKLETILANEGDCFPDAEELIVDARLQLLRMGAPSPSTGDLRSRWTQNLADLRGAFQRAIESRYARQDVENCRDALRAGADMLAERAAFEANDVNVTLKPANPKQHNWVDIARNVKRNRFTATVAALMYPPRPDRDR